MIRCKISANPYLFLKPDLKKGCEIIKKEEDCAFKRISLVEAIEAKKLKHVKIANHCVIGINLLNTYIEKSDDACLLDDINRVFLNEKPQSDVAECVLMVILEIEEILKSKKLAEDKKRLIQGAIAKFENNRKIASSKVRMMETALNALDAPCASREKFQEVVSQERVGKYSYREAVGFFAETLVFSMKSETDELVQRVMALLPSENHLVPILLKGSDRSTSPQNDASVAHAAAHAR